MRTVTYSMANTKDDYDSRRDVHNERYGSIRAIPRESLGIIRESFSGRITKHIWHYDCRFEIDTTVAYLSGYAGSGKASMLRYDGRLVFTLRNYRNEVLVAVYNFLDDPESFFSGIGECRVRLETVADGTFADEGHAALWAMEWVNRQKKDANVP